MIIYLDVSYTAQSAFNTGIQRVVWNMTREMCINEYIIPIVLNGDGYYTCKRFNEQLLYLPKYQLGGNKVEFKTGDVLFLPDSTWDSQIKNNKSIKYLKDNGVCVVSLIHDLIPITHPSFCYDGCVSMFSEWAYGLQENVHGTLCVSEYVVNTVKTILKWEKPITSLYLGCDLKSTCTPFQIPTGKNILMVSTVEPRKGYDVAVKAMNTFWETSDHSVNLIIVGTYGWKVDHIKTLITENTELNKRLFWYDKVPDGELVYLYQNCDVLLFASEVEGFGLATVEASFYGKPVILRDREIFREIGGNNAVYFDTPSELCTIIREWDDGTMTLPSSSGIKRVTWKECAQECIKKLIDMRHTYMSEFLSKRTIFKNEKIDTYLNIKHASRI